MLLKHVTTFCRILNRRQTIITPRMNILRMSSIDTQSSDTDNDLDESDDFVGIEDSIGTHFSITNKSELNKSFANDPLMIALNNCASVQNLFDFVKSKANSMNHEHVSQTVQFLFELQKIYYHINVSRLDINSPDYIHPTDLLNNYITQINAHEDFKFLLGLIRNNYAEFSIETLSLIFLYLTRMGVKISDETNQLLIQRCRELFKTQKEFAMNALASYVCGVASEQDLRSTLCCVDILPIIYEKLDSCNNENDFKLLTVCLYNMPHVITNDLIQKYMEKSKDILREANENNISVFVKTILLLNNPQWFINATSLLRHFILMLKNKVYLMKESEFIKLHKVYRYIHEPANMFNEIHRHASKLLVESKESPNYTIENNLQLLTCVVIFCSPLQRKIFENLVKKYVNVPLNIVTFTSLYKIISRLKITDRQICNPFWSRAFEMLSNNSAKINHHLLATKICQKYLIYCTGTNNACRNTKFEKNMVNFIENEFHCNSIGTLVPGFIFTYASFLIAFCKNESTLKYIKNRIQEIDYQMKSIDCLMILKGIQSKTMKQSSYDWKDIENVVCRQIQTLVHSSANDNNYSNVTCLLKSIKLMQWKHRKLTENFLQEFRLDENTMSSRIIQDFCYLLQNSNSLIPPLIDGFINYTIKNSDYVFATTTTKLVYLCYYLGYWPTNGRQFFDTVSNTVLRDQERLSGLLFLQSALSLCFYNNLPESITKQIFSVEFLEKLDEELFSCYSKEIYPIRVRHQLMQLNRAVCFDYPNSNIPWFHQKYVEETYTKGKIKKSSNHFVYIEQVLKKVLGENNYETNVITPYGYHIDFIVYLDKNNKPLNVEASKTSLHSKVAILLLGSNAYTNTHKNLKGQYQLKKRHLEILGYHVFEIDSRLWSLLFLPQDKISFIQNVLSTQNRGDQNIETICT